MARLYEAFGSPRRAMQAGAGEITRRTGLREKLAETIAAFHPPEDEIKKDIEILEGLGVRVITRWDPEYPSNLKEIYDPPALLFVRGQVMPEDSRAVALVGSRNPTRYGLEMTEQITRGLVRGHVTAISGLARGIDTACHRAALNERGRTVGVLGCGINVHYPRENGALIEEMIGSGAVISEFRPGVPPLATNFYRRNRLVSGLVKGVVVVQATRNSGSLITASHALDQNRDVFAVPGNVMDSRSWGPHSLLKQGAGLVESAEDILTSLFERPKPVKPQPGFFDTTDGRDRDVSDEAEQVLESLDPDPAPIDLLCESLKIEVGRLSGILLELELKGLIRQHPGKMFSRILH